MAIQDVIKRLIYQFTSTGADKVAADMGKVNTEQDKLAVGATKTTKASLDLTKSFENMERRFDSTIRAQQDYQKVQDKVNAAVAQNPALQERANSVLALAAQHFDKAGKATSAYAGAVDAARGAALGLAAGIGPLGAVLGSFGPWGIAAAAGIGLVTNAFTYLSEGAAKMGDEIVKLKQFSNVTGLTTTQVIGLSEAGQELGISSEAIKTGIEKFTVGLSEARKGSGDLFGQLREIDEQLAIQISSTRSSTQALDLLAKAYNSTTDAVTRAALARAAFGKSGVSTGPVLDVIAAEGVEKYSRDAAAALGVTEEWATEVDRLQKSIKDLRGDIETVNAVVYTKEVLARQEQFYQAQLRIAKAMQESALRGDAYAPDFGTGNVVPFQVPQQITGEAGRGGMGRDAAAAAAAAAAEVAELEKKWAGVSEATRRASELAEAMIPVYQAVGGAAQREAQFSADITAELGKQKTAKEALVIAADKYIAAEAKSLAAVQATTRALEEQNELAKARNIQDEKRIASQQAYDKVIKELGDTEAGPAAANERSSAVEESYRIKIADKTREAAINARDLQNAFNATVFSAQAVAEATDIIAENTARAAKTAADFARAMQLGTFAPNVMPTGQHEFSAAAQVSYRGGGTGKILDVAGGKPAMLAAAEASYMARYGLTTVDPQAASQAIIDAMQDNTTSIDKLKDSTDSLNATNQELLSPYYTMDPRTSHIGFRSQGMAAGGYVDVPGSPSANDNMIAQIPVASGERIYVDPMTVKRGNAGTTINITAPMTFTGPVDRDQVGRTVYQNMQMASRSIAAAQR